MLLFKFYKIQLNTNLFDTFVKINKNHFNSKYDYAIIET